MLLLLWSTPPETHSTPAPERRDGGHLGTSVTGVIAGSGSESST
jgi:hypothetical protein